MMNSSTDPYSTNHGPPPGGNWFLGLAVSENVRLALARAQAALRPAAEAAGASCSWVHPEDFHVTVLFIGPWRSDRAAALAGAADAAAKRAAGFDLRVGGVGCFGPPRAPRILWAGVDVPEILQRIRADCIENLSHSGLFPDDRPYRPHLTLARVRSRPRGLSLTEGLRRLQDEQFGFVPVRDLRVMRGVPGARGPRYRTEWVAPLTGE